ncbi:hypothetical protein [Thermocrinis sp.]|uniref:hypothetical protein n=1 Tax=Thermocrinis sp. TaxID=2024383 RepID=UPI002FDCFE1C
MKRILYLTTIFMLLSISVFEGFVIVLMAYTFYLIARGGLKPYGRLLSPLLLHAIPTILSTFLYTPSQTGKAIERSLFLLIYPLGGKEKLSYEFFKKFNQLLIFTGVLLIPVVLYNFHKDGILAPLWGGVFEVGFLYSFFSISALSMFLFTKRKIYFVLFLIFMEFVFASMRRSAVMGLVFTLLLIIYLVRKIVSKKFVIATLTFMGFSMVITFSVLVQKDQRFSTMTEVLLGQEALNEETLDVISSIRWTIFKAGLEVIKKDLKEGNYLPLLIGRGLNSGYYLEPKSPVGGTYESVFLLSEFIEKGILGLLGILWLWWAYYSYILKLKLRKEEDFLLIPSLSFLSTMLIGSVFTMFWDAMLPWTLLVFRVAEKHLESS